MSIKSINPATGETIAEYEETSPEEVDQLLEKAGSTFRSWRRVSHEERGSLLHRAAEILESRREELAKLMADEMGKPIAGGRGEVDKCAWVCRYYADNGADFLADEHIEADKKKSYVHFEPIGAVLAVMPWNFPCGR